jgi:Putative Ig domain
MQHLHSPTGTGMESPLGALRFSLQAIVILTAVFSITSATAVGAATAPMFTSADSVTFPQSIYSSFTITTSGSPIPSITQTGHLPGGVKFTDNGDGTATLSGRPGNGKGLVGDYALKLTASNGVLPAAVQNFTLTISKPPRILSVNNATFVVGTTNTFTVKTLSTVPKSILSITGALPTGVTFAANKNGTATLSGDPAAGTEGVYKITLTAKNGTLPNATQLFTLTVQDAVPIVRAPTITSAANTTFTAGVEGTFTVRTSALPTASLSLTGTLPEWLVFIDNTDGTATLAGVPDLGGAASYTFTVTAANGIAPDAVQTFTLFVLNPSPAITSVDNATFVIGISNSFTVKTKATSPISVLSSSGTLPSGVSFVPNTNGTATLSGTPAGGSGGTYPLIITAANGTPPNAAQNFTLTVQATPPLLQAPAITSAAASTFTVGSHGTFTVTTNGMPTSQVTLIGAQPSWLSYVDNTDGTATMSGTPDSESDVSYSFTITAANGVLPNATQAFVLTVKQAPMFTSPASATFAVGIPGSFIVETRGNPVASLTKTGTLPSGVSFLDNGDGTANIAGTPAAGSADSYPITVTAANGVMPNAAQIFTLAITDTPVPTPTPTPSPTPTPTPAPAQLLNISTRLLTKTGENVAIGGFIVAGSDLKTVLIRGLGPSLAAFVPNPLPDPTLELHQGSSVIASNDDWQDTPNVGQIPTGFEPADPRDSVIIATLSPGPYTVVQAAKDPVGGIGLLEIYDIDSAGDAMLANISTRGLVQTGDEAMIGGFILQGGTEGSTVVVRAIGPSLTSFGISNALADPTLELHDANGGLIGANDNWQDDAAQANEVMATGFAPGVDLESAMVATLPPAAYTAIVTGKGGTGVALVEIYNLQ